MSRSSLRLSLFVLLLSTLAPGTPGGSLLLAQADAVHEIGGTAPSPDAESDTYPDLESLNTMLDLAVQYTSFTGDDMGETYVGLPTIALGISVQTAKRARTFLSLGYGERQGDAYRNLAGFSGVSDITVRAVPVLLGLKVDLARSHRVHVYAGAAIEFAWTQETIPYLTDSGRIEHLTATGLNNGFQLTFGPEIVLGPSGQAVGLEFGWGGTKGEVTTKGHNHAVDLTGFRGRMYFALKL